MVKEQKASKSECYTRSSEPFRFYVYCTTKKESRILAQMLLLNRIELKNAVKLKIVHSPFM
jgi:hypothetical protein